MEFAENYIDKICEKYNTNDNPGICIGIIQNNELVFCKGYGVANLEYNIPITGDSVFHCASMAKQFTAMCAALLVEEDKLACTDSIRLYFPELPACMDKVNISHLVYMTNGIYCMYDTANCIYGIRENDFITEDEAWNFIKASDWLMFPPGEKWSYGNTGYFLLGQLVKRITGLTISEYADRYIFKPLKMNHTFLRDDRSKIIKNRAVGYSSYIHVHYNDCVQKHTTKNDRLSINEELVDIPGAGQLWTTVNDLVHWDNNFYSNSLGKGGQTLIEMITTPGRLNNGRITNYGYGLFVFEKDGYKHISHGGWAGGYSSYLDRIIDRGLSVIVLGNHTDIFGDIDVYENSNGITDKIMRHVLNIKPSEIIIPVNKIENLDKKTNCDFDISGKYQCESNSFIWEIVKADDGFEICQNYEHKFTIFYVGDNKFITDNDLTLLINGEDKSINTIINSEKCMFMPFIENMSESDLSEYIGTYNNKPLNLSFDISVNDGKLFVKNVNRHNSAVDFLYSPTIKDSFMTKVSYIGYYCISFQRDENNGINSFVYRTDSESKRENFIFTKVICKNKH